jgi:hypothetical protein
MENSLADDNFIQYKCKNYTIGVYYRRTHKNATSGLSKIGINETLIKAPDLVAFESFPLSIEATIQRLNNIDMPDEYDLDGWDDLAFQLVNDYGFLFFNKYIDDAKDEIEYEMNTDWNWPTLDEYITKDPYAGDKPSQWKDLIQTIQITLKRVNDSEFSESMSSTDKFFNDSRIKFYLNGVSPQFDVDTQSIKLKPNSLASAIMLSIVSNNKHLKTCEVCSKLFFAKRSTTKYCSTTCGRSNQGSRKGKS